MSARIPPISFISWLRDEAVMIDEARDFIADARGDDTFPTDIRSMARIAWRQYKAARRELAA